MLNTLKNLVRSLLASMGLVLLRRENYLRLLVSHEPSTTSSQPRAVEMPPIVSREEAAADESGDAEFNRFMRTLRGRVSCTPDITQALYSAALELKAAGVAGDVVDCGNGLPAALAIIGAALVFKKDASRNLLLLDVSGDPTHRFEPELVLWGGESDLLAVGHGSRRPKSRGDNPLPAELASIGYPLERVVVAHGPVGPLAQQDLPRGIALLKLTVDGYPANRAAIRKLAPLVNHNGFVVVEGTNHTGDGQDLVTDLFLEQTIQLRPFRSVGGLRISQRAG